MACGTYISPLLIVYCYPALWMVVSACGMSKKIFVLRVLRVLIPVYIFDQEVKILVITMLFCEAWRTDFDL